MKLLKLSLYNFKRFTEGEFTLSPGLNLFWGPNESGKSTIHQSISCALFGRERGQAVENWNGGNCSVVLDYRSDETSYRLEIKITEGLSTIGRIVDGQPTDLISAKEEVGRLIADHLGITSRTTFENTVSIRQMCVSSPDVAQLEAVGSEIQRVLTGTAHLSAGEVQKRLESQRDAIKGRARPTNPREYDRITTRLRELAENLADGRGSRDQVNNLEEEHTHLESRIERDSERLATLSELLDRLKRWSELLKRQGESDKRHAEIFSTTRKIKETLSELRVVQEELEDYADLVGRDDEIADHLLKTEGRSRDLDERLNELANVSDETHGDLGHRWSQLSLVSAVLTVLSAVAVRLWVAPWGLWLLVPAAAFAFLFYGLHTTRPATESRQIADLSNSARTELEQLEAEQQNILAFINCKTADQAWARIKAYRNLASRCHEMELTLNTLLGGRALNDWEDEESSAAREISTIRAELESDFAGYAPSTEETESWRAEHAALQVSLPSATKRLNEVVGALESERRSYRDLAALEGEIEFLHQRRNELDFTFKAYEEAIAALSTVSQVVAEEYLPALCERATDFLGWVTSGRYTSIVIKPGWEISVDCREKASVAPSSLSAGTVDQLYLALRMACGELLSAGRALPLILDDPFASFDRTRLDSVLALIAALARENQILLLTHDPYILEWARNIARSEESPCTIHELRNPAIAIS